MFAQETTSPATLHPNSKAKDAMRIAASVASILGRRTSTDASGNLPSPHGQDPRPTSPEPFAKPSSARSAQPARVDMDGCLDAGRRCVRTGQHPTYTSKTTCP